MLAHWGAAKDSNSTCSTPKSIQTRLNLGWRETLPVVPYQQFVRCRYVVCDTSDINFSLNNHAINVKLKWSIPRCLCSSGELASLWSAPAPPSMTGCRVTIIAQGLPRETEAQRYERLTVRQRDDIWFGNRCHGAFTTYELPALLPPSTPADLRLRRSAGIPVAPTSPPAMPAPAGLQAVPTFAAPLASDAPAPSAPRHATAPAPDPPASESCRTSIGKPESSVKTRRAT